MNAWIKEHEGDGRWPWFLSWLKERNIKLTAESLPDIWLGYEGGWHSAGQCGGMQSVLFPPMPRYQFSDEERQKLYKKWAAGRSRG